MVGSDLTALVHRIGDRPFMFMASGGFGPDYFGDLVSTVWHDLPGWRRFFSVTVPAPHNDFAHAVDGLLAALLPTTTGT